MFSIPRIPNNLRERAIGMLDAGMLTEHVARHVGCSSRAIRNIRIRLRTTGSTKDLPHCGRPHGTTCGQARYIMNTHLCNRFQTATASAANTPGLHNYQTCVQNVRIHLRENSLHAQHPLRRLHEYFTLKYDFLSALLLSRQREINNLQ